MSAAESVRIQCPHCGKRLKVAANLAGRRVTCPNPGCGQTIAVPSADVEAEPAAAPRRSRWPLVAAGGVGVVLIAGVVFYIATSGKGRNPEAAPPAVAKEAPAADGKREPPPAPEPAPAVGLTAEQLAGTWEAAMPDGGLFALRFTPELVGVASLGPGTNHDKAMEALDFVSGGFGRGLGGGGFGMGSTSYKIEGAEIKFGFPESTATGRLTAGGELVVSGEFKTTNLTFTVPETKLGRAKAGGPAKAPVEKKEPAAGPTLARFAGDWTDQWHRLVIGPDGLGYGSTDFGSTYGSGEFQIRDEDRQASASLPHPGIGQPLVKRLFDLRLKDADSLELLERGGDGRYLLKKQPPRPAAKPADFAGDWKTWEVTGGKNRDAVLTLKDLAVTLAADGTGTWKLAGPSTKLTVQAAGEKFTFAGPMEKTWELRLIPLAGGGTILRLTAEDGLRVYLIKPRAGKKKAFE